MKTLLIGYEIKKGSFTSEKTGEVIDYNNRILRFITDSGSTKENVGYAPFSEKFKMTDLAKCFGVPETDVSVDAVLQNGLQHEWELAYRPVGDKMACVYVKQKKPETK